jgi:hypothetical protein
VLSPDEACSKYVTHTYTCQWHRKHISITNMGVVQEYCHSWGSVGFPSQHVSRGLTGGGRVCDLMQGRAADRGKRCHPDHTCRTSVTAHALDRPCCSAIASPEPDSAVAAAAEVRSSCATAPPPGSVSSWPSLSAGRVLMPRSVTHRAGPAGRQHTKQHRQRSEVTT